MGRLGLEGLRVLVTASTRGLGKGIAEVLLSEGCIVTINGSSKTSVERSVDPLKEKGVVHGVAADLRDPNQVVSLVDKSAELMSGLDALVYVPPPPPPGAFSELRKEEWDIWSRALVLSPVWAVRAALRHIRPRRDFAGGIVFVTSIAVKEPIPDTVLSNVLRLSIHGLVKSLARELGPRGIRVNAVMPGYFMTDRLRALVKRWSDEIGKSEEEVLASITQNVPLKRVGDPQELGWAVAFLLSPLASYVNGASIPVDGGSLVSIF